MSDDQIMCDKLIMKEYKYECVEKFAAGTIRDN